MIRIKVRLIELTDIVNDPVFDLVVKLRNPALRAALLSDFGAKLLHEVADWQGFPLVPDFGCGSLERS